MRSKFENRHVRGVACLIAFHPSTVTAEGSQVPPVDGEKEARRGWRALAQVMGCKLHYWDLNEGL